jgi:hypothetical protein
MAGPRSKQVQRSFQTSRASGEGQATIGFKVKSGYAIAVLLVGPMHSPQALNRRVVDLSDPEMPATKQPYHAAMGTREEDADKIRQRTEVIQDVAERSVTELLADYRAAGHRIRHATLVVGSQIDPDKIANPHIRAHALEGRLFRRVLADALQTHGVSSSVVLERDAYRQAAKLLGRSEGELKQTLARLGKEVGGPWRAEEKLAALAAWMRLA